MQLGWIWEMPSFWQWAPAVHVQRTMEWKERADDGYFRKKLCNLLFYLGLPGYSSFLQVSLLASAWKIPGWGRHVGLQNPKQLMTSSAQQSSPGQAGAEAPVCGLKGRECMQKCDWLRLGLSCLYQEQSACRTSSEQAAKFAKRLHKQ